MILLHEEVHQLLLFCGQKEELIVDGGKGRNSRGMWMEGNEEVVEMVADGCRRRE